MKNVRIELNLHGIRELLKSKEMQAVLRENVKQICHDANNMAVVDGAKYHYNVHVADYTALGGVATQNDASKEDNFENNTLLKALGKSGLKKTKD